MLMVTNERQTATGTDAATMVPPVARPRVRDRLLTSIDLIATFILAMQAALVGVQADLDLFGILLVTFVASTGGGIMRDLLLGEHPPAAFRDSRYTLNAAIAVAVVVGVASLSGPNSDYTPPVLVKVVAAAGLAFSPVAATKKAIQYHLAAGSVIVIAIIGGCAGGILRDVLIMRIPAILRSDFYATIAMLGAGLMLVLVRRIGTSQAFAAAATGVFVFSLRIAAIAGGWSLPHVS